MELWRMGLGAQVVSLKRGWSHPPLWRMGREELSPVKSKFGECDWWENRTLLRKFKLRASYFFQWIRWQSYKPFHHCQYKSEGTTFMEQFKKWYLSMTTWTCIFVKSQSFSNFLLDGSPIQQTCTQCLLYVKYCVGQWAHRDEKGPQWPTFVSSAFSIL